MSISPLSGPVLRDTARLSQRYPPIARYGVFWCLNMANWVRYPSPFSERFPLGEHAKWRCDTPPRKGYLSDTSAIPYENKANGCDTPLCDTISKGYCAIWGGISHWAAKFHPLNLGVAPRKHCKTRGFGHSTLGGEMAPPKFRGYGLTGESKGQVKRGNRSERGICL